MRGAMMSVESRERCDVTDATRRETMARLVLSRNKALGRIELFVDSLTQNSPARCPIASFATLERLPIRAYAPTSPRRPASEGVPARPLRGTS